MKTFLFAFVLTIIAYGIGIAVGFWLDDGPNDPRWHCKAEDEVVVIDNSCRHIDSLFGEAVA